MSEKNCTWHFAIAQGGQDLGPNEAMQEIFKKTPYDSLVRESIQNWTLCRISVNQSKLISELRL